MLWSSIANVQLYRNDQVSVAQYTHSNRYIFMHTHALIFWFKYILLSLITKPYPRCNLCPTKGTLAQFFTTVTTRLRRIWMQSNQCTWHDSLGNNIFQNVTLFLVLYLMAASKCEIPLAVITNGAPLRGRFR